MKYITRSLLPTCLLLLIQHAKLRHEPTQITSDKHRLSYEPRESKPTKSIRMFNILLSCPPPSSRDLPANSCKSRTTPQRHQNEPNLPIACMNRQKVPRSWVAASLRQEGVWNHACQELLLDAAEIRQQAHASHAKPEWTRPVFDSEGASWTPRTSDKWQNKTVAFLCFFMLFYAFLIFLYLFNSFYIFCMLFYAFFIFFQFSALLDQYSSIFPQTICFPMFPRSSVFHGFPMFSHVFPRWGSAAGTVSAWTGPSLVSILTPRPRGAGGCNRALAARLPATSDWAWLGREGVGDTWKILEVDGDGWR